MSLCKPPSVEFYFQRQVLDVGKRIQGVLELAAAVQAHDEKYHSLGKEAVARCFWIVYQPVRLFIEIS